jgi:O-antigen/teichoic acid export membrane protein
MITKQNRIEIREKRIKYTAITAILSKLLAMLVPLVTVRYAFDYLGAEVYGLWNAVLSFFSMFAFADLGLGSGLQTELSQTSGRDDWEYARKLVASTYYILILSTMVMMFVMLILFPIVDWGAIMNVESAMAEQLVGTVVFIIVSSKLLNIPFSLVNRTQLALQEGYKGNIWQCIANILSIALIVLVVLLNIGRIPLIIVSAYTVVIVSILNFVVYFGVQRKEYFPHWRFADFKVCKSMMKIGIAFCLLSIFTSLGLSLDNFIVAKISSLSESATYSILYRATSLISVGCSMLSTPLWGVFGEALERGDYKWVQIRARKTALLSLASSVVCAVGLLSLGKILFSIWLGKTLEYNNYMLFGMALHQCLLSLISPYFMVLNARGIVKKQIYVFVFYTLASLALKFSIGTICGIGWVPLVGAICYGLIIVPYVYKLAKKEIGV